MGVLVRAISFWVGLLVFPAAGWARLRVRTWSIRMGARRSQRCGRGLDSIYWSRMIFVRVFQPTCPGGRSRCPGDGDEGRDSPAGCWLCRGGIGGAGGGGGGDGVRGPASGARPSGCLGFLLRVRGSVGPGRPGGGVRPCFPAAREPDRLAVPGGGAGGRPACLLVSVRAPCPDRSPGVVARGPGVRLVVQLDLGGPPRHGS
jgi:hypothetical protein